MSALLSTSRSGLGEVDVAQTAVVRGEPSMSGSGRRILTSKVIALSALALAFVVIAVARRRHLNARQWPPDSERPQLFKPGW